MNKKGELRNMVASCYRKSFVCVTALVVVALLGFYLGTLYQTSANTFKTEQVVAEEIALLEQHKNKPSCEQVMKQSDTLTTEAHNGVILYWYFRSSDDHLKRLLVDSDLTIAYEEIGSYCNR